MPRRPRVHLPGQPLHIVQRGHNREACFFAEEDYHAYLHWLGEALVATEVQLHAYVLMTNHVHLLLTPPDAEAIPRMVIALGRRFVQYINRSYHRTGTLWDSRYKSSLIDSDSYLLTCMRYIELNPVRANLAVDPAHYRWSSYRANGLAQADVRLTPHEVYVALGATQAARCGAYRGLFRSELDAAAVNDIRLALNQNQPLGNGRFLARVARAVGERRQARPRGRPRVVKSEAACVVEQGELGL